jgi:hypothetical protein
MPSLAPDRESPDLTILIPSSLTAETRDRRIKTYKVGQIARAASVFRNFEDVLAASVVEATPAAIDLGIEVGMPASQALERMF